VNKPHHRSSFVLQDGFLAARELVDSGAPLGPVPVFSTTGRLACALRHTTEKSIFVKSPGLCWTSGFFPGPTLRATAVLPARIRLPCRDSSGAGISPQIPWRITSLNTFGPADPTSSEEVSPSQACGLIAAPRVRLFWRTRWVPDFSGVEKPLEQGRRREFIRSSRPRRALVGAPRTEPSAGLSPRVGGPTAEWRWLGPTWPCPLGPGC
jgi:hypothetical protein